MMELLALAQQCAPAADQETLTAIVRQESSNNPYAIGVVNGKLIRQPKNKGEAIATAKALEAAGWNYSLGLAQINKYNLPKYKLTISEAFDPCANLKVGAQIFNECHTRAKEVASGESQALHMALSCYYSGNFKTGFQKTASGGPSYVEKVANNLSGDKRIIKVVPIEENKQKEPAPINSPVLLKRRKQVNRNEAANIENTKANNTIVF